MLLMAKERTAVYLTPQQVADDLGMAKSTVLEWLREKKLPGYQFGNRWRVDQTDFEDWKRKRKNTQE